MPTLLGLGLVGAALALLIGWPLVELAAEAGADPGGAARAATGPGGLEAIGNSLWTSAAVTLLAVAGGLALAVLLEHWLVRGRAALLVALVGSLLIPDFVVALSWARAYGPAGLLDQLLGWQLPGLYGPAGVVVVLAAGAVPLAFLLIVAGMRARGEPDHVRAARIHGASALMAFRRVSLPLLWPVLLAAGGLVFATTMNAFGTPTVLGRPAGFATMTTRIYGDLAFSSSDAAFQRVLGLSLLLVVLVVGTLAVARRIGSREVGASSVVHVAGRARPATRLAQALAWAFVTLTVAIPLVALVLQALTRAVGLPPLPEHLTLANFGRAVDSRTLPALANTLVLASGAALSCLALALAVSIAAGRRWRRRVSSLVTLGFAVPGSVLAVGVLLAYGRPLRDSLLLILVAYVAKLWALAERPVGAAWERRSWLDSMAARVHGADVPTTLRAILLPLMAPTLLAAGFLVFVFAMQEVTISILLYGPRTATLAVEILNLQQLGDPTVTTALAVLLTMLIGVAAAPLLLLRRWWAGGALT